MSDNHALAIKDSKIQLMKIEELERAKRHYMAMASYLAKVIADITLTMPKWRNELVIEGTPVNATREDILRFADKRIKEMSQIMGVQHEQ